MNKKTDAIVKKQPFSLLNLKYYLYFCSQKISNSKKVFQPIIKTDD